MRKIPSGYAWKSSKPATPEEQDARTVVIAQKAASTRIAQQGIKRKPGFLVLTGTGQ